jgi:hypothetical protein
MGKCRGRRGLGGRRVVVGSLAHCWWAEDTAVGGGVRLLGPDMAEATTNTSLILLLILFTV